MGSLGFWEMAMIAVVVLLVFGAKRLPEIGGSIGKGIREFKKSISEIESAGSPNIGSSAADPRTLPNRQFDAPDAAGAPPQGEPKRLSQ